MSIFDGVSTGSIDFSPYQPVPVVTIILDEAELANCKEFQFERFWRVWYTERSFYAPALQTLVLGLRRSSDSWEGIRRFIDYFEQDILFRHPRVGLDIYLTNGDDPQYVLSVNPAMYHRYPVSIPQALQVL
jgi:hypothetical protein|uniref:Uncharacterized protein n=1 Tax=viral metagenome TaxID=1070528 RepID=A0A6C0LLS6_9ZZZZ